VIALPRRERSNATPHRSDTLRLGLDFSKSDCAAMGSVLVDGASLSLPAWNIIRPSGT
jgi:hypothetical protein